MSLVIYMLLYAEITVLGIFWKVWEAIYFTDQRDVRNIAYLTENKLITEDVET